MDMFLILDSIDLEMDVLILQRCVFCVSNFCIHVKTLSSRNNTLIFNFIIFSAVGKRIGDLGC